MLTTGAAAAALLPFTEGLRVLDSAGVAVGLVVIALFTVLVGHWLHTLPGATPAAEGSGPGSSPRADPCPAVGTAVQNSPSPELAARDVASLRDLLRVLPLDLLLLDWRYVAAPRQRCADEPDLARYRQLLLDELQSRDPARFARRRGHSAA